MARRLKLATTLAISVLGFAVLLGQTPAHSNGMAKIQPRVMRDLASKGQASIVIYLRDQADLSAAYGMKNENARGWYVYRTLKEHAARTQAPILELLASRGVHYRSFWVANVIFAQAGQSLVQDLAARPDVTTIEADDASRWITDEKVSSSKSRSPATIEPGVVKVHAPDLWNRSNQSHRNEPAIRVGGGFAARNGDIVTGAKALNALIKLLNPGDVKIARERQCDQCSSRFSAHRGDIAQAAPERFVTDRFRVGGWLKMNSLDDRVCFEKEITIGNAEVEHSAVIAGSDENALVSGKLFGQSLDEFEFVHGSRIRQSAGQSVSTRC